MIFNRFISVLLVAILSCAAHAQTVRFETNVGSFDMELNPTHEPQLQGNVDNLLQYVTAGRYDNTVINRAEAGFVLQMGVFQSPGAKPPATISGFVPIVAFPPVIGVPAANTGLSNTSGMVGFALSGSYLNLDHNSATSSFYINLNNNSFLDADYRIFAQIPNMTTISAIMALPHVDYTQVPGFGADPGNLHFTDVPLLANGDLVVISHAFVVAVPEPSTFALVRGFLPGLVTRRSRRNRSF